MLGWCVVAVINAWQYSWVWSHCTAHQGQFGVRHLNKLAPRAAWHSHRDRGQVEQLHLTQLEMSLMYLLAGLPCSLVTCVPCTDTLL